MAITRKEKEQILVDLEGRLKNAKSIVFADYRGTNVKKMTALRKHLSKENVYAKVVKISLIKRALQKQGIDTALMDFKAPVALAISEQDEAAAAKALNAFALENKNFQILLGVMDGQVISAKQVKALAALPSKMQLRAALVGAIARPMSGLANVLAGSIRKLVYVLNVIQSKN